MGGPSCPGNSRYPSRLSLLSPDAGSRPTRRQAKAAASPPLGPRGRPAGRRRKSAGGRCRRGLTAAERFGGYQSTYGDQSRQILRIQFRSPGPDDAALETLRPLLLKSPLPIGLNLNGCAAVSDAGLAHLAEIPAIRELYLDSQNITDAGLRNLSGLASLEVLYLSTDGISDAGLAHLGKLAKLRNLSVYSKAVTDAGYAGLAGLADIEEIHVGGISHDLGDACLESMKGMTKLKELSVGGDALTDAGMAVIATFAELRKLRMRTAGLGQGCGLVGGAEERRGTDRLEHARFRRQGPGRLEGMGRLARLELVYTPALDKEGGVHLGKLAALKKLRLSSVSEGSLEGLGSLAGLEELDLNYSQVGDGDLKFLGGLAGLKDLDVQHTQVTDAGLKHLAGLRNLRKLNVSDDKVTDAGLASLAGIPALENLVAINCQITGTAFQDLARLAKLTAHWRSAAIPWSMRTCWR